MKKNIAVAWSLGFLVLLISHCFWYIVLTAYQPSYGLRIFWWASFSVAAFLVSYISLARKILLGISMAIPGAMLSGGLNLIYELTGHPVDFPGWNATIVLVLLSLPWYIILCFVGSIAGYFFKKVR